MRAAKNTGGLQVLDLCLYYEAANLSNLVRALSRDVDFQWKDIEQNYTMPNTLEETIWSNDKKQLKKLNGLEGLFTMITIWNRKRTKLVDGQLPLSIFTNQTWLLPGVGNGFQMWHEHKMNRLTDVFPKGHCLDKMQMESKLGPQNRMVQICSI